MDPIVAAVQRRLAELGYKPGPDDGVDGPKTAAAVLAFGWDTLLNDIDIDVMRTSPRGIAALACHEGIVPGPYLDSEGVWTFGIGHTAAAGEPIPYDLPKGMPADMDDTLNFVFEVFARDLARYEADVRAALKMPLAQHEFDAAVSFHYNTGAIGRAAWVALCNSGDRTAAATGFMGWRRPSSIVARREAEQRLFRDGIYPTQPVNVWRVDSGGRVIWRPVMTLSQANVVARVQAASA